MGQVGSTSTSSSRKRRVAVRFIVVALAAAIASAALIGTGVLHITSSAREAGCYREEVPIYTSPHDRDGDGIDDQADILAALSTMLPRDLATGARTTHPGIPMTGTGCARTWLPSPCVMRDTICSHW